MRMVLRSVRLVVAISLVGELVLVLAGNILAAEQSNLQVGTVAEGGVHATAMLLIPAPLADVQAILTDYTHWPDLFDTPMRLARLERQGGRVITDLYISHTLLPGERRLICESRELPEGGLVTALLGGDFKQYLRTWRLSPADGGRQTRAEFAILVEVDTLVPDWLVALAMRRELETHFRILAEKATARERAH